MPVRTGQVTGPVRRLPQVDVSQVHDDGCLDHTKRQGEHPQADTRTVDHRDGMLLLGRLYDFLVVAAFAMADPKAQSSITYASEGTQLPDLARVRADDYSPPLPDSRRLVARRRYFQ